MIASHLSLAHGGAPLPAGPLTLVQPQAGPFRPVFRRVLHLRLATGGRAHRAAVAAQGAALAGTFGPLTHDARATAGLVTLASSGVGVRVTLAVPQQVLRPVFTAAPSGSPTRTYQLFRLAGDAPGPDPAASAAEGQNLGADFTDLRFDVRLTAGGVPAPLAPAALQGLQVKSYPSSPRILVAPFGAPAEAVVVWTAPGEVGRQQPASAGTVQAGAALVDALVRFLEAMPPPLPAAADFLVTLESDAPCTFTPGSVAVPYRLLREGFPAPAAGEAPPEKEVLRFGGDAAERREVRWEVPVSASILSASIEVSPSLRGEAPAEALPAGGSTGSAGGTSTESTESSGSADGGLGRDRGAVLEPGRWVAQAVTPARAALGTGVSLGVLPLSAGAEARVEVREDAGGRPTGRVLASGTVPLGALGRRGWATLAFRDPLVLPSAPLWVVAVLPAGSGVWLGREAAGAALTGPAPADGAFGEPEGELAGVELLARVLERPAPLASAGGEGGPGGRGIPPLPALTLSLGAQVIQPTPADGGRLRFDLRTALAAFLPGKPAPGGLVQVPLVFRAPVQGLVTVYPPRLEYDV